MHSQDPQQPIGLQPQAPFCVSCQAPLVGGFCAHCGEKRITRHDYSLAHFFEHGLETLTHFDFKIFSTLKTLIVKPGQLTLDFLQGRRKGRVPPIQLFVLVNIAFVVFIHWSGFSPFSTPMQVHTYNGPFVEYKVQRLESEIAASGVDGKEFERAFNKAADLQGKTWVIIFIPFWALLFAMLYGFRRYFYEMVVFSTHFWGVVLLLMASAMGLWAFIEYGLQRYLNVALSYELDQYLGGLIVRIGIGVYLYKSLRQVFGDTWWAALLRTLAITYLFFIIVNLYRLLLFFLTLWAM